MVSIEPQPAPELSPGDRLLRDVEALLFAAGRPLDVETITSACSHSEAVLPAAVADALARLAEKYPVDGPRGFELARVAGGWLFRTNSAARPALTRLFDVTEDLRLSPAAMETLAIVAYLQPVSRPEIAEIRGVNSDTALHTLVDRELVREVGRRDAPGGAILYGTTSRFLIAFDLDSISSLPPIERFEVGEEQREELRRRLGLVVAPG
jgi:segregation and condensation protein B